MYQASVSLSQFHKLPCHGLWTQVGRKKHVLHGEHIGDLVNVIEPSICGSDVAMSNYFDHLFRNDANRK